MVPNDDKISSFQLGLLIFLTPVGVGIFTLPAVLAKDVETNGWIVLMIGGLINLLIIYFISEVGKKYAAFGFVETLKFLFGKFLGTLFSIPIFVFYLIFTMIEIRMFGETTKMYLLFNTPLEWLIIPIFLLAIILVRLGIEQTARFFEAISYVVVLTLILVFLVILPKSNYSNLLPILKVEPLKFLKGISDGIFSFAGFEILFLLFPFIRKPEKAFKSSAIGLLAVTIVYILIVNQCIVRFGTDYTKTLLYPTLSLIKASDIPGAFIEGIEGILFSLWIIFIYTTIVAFVFGYMIIGADLTKHREKKHMAILFMPIIYILSLQPDSVADVIDLGDKLVLYLGYYTLYFIPIIMYVTSRIKGAKKT